MNTKHFFSKRLRLEQGKKINHKLIDALLIKHYCHLLNLTEKRDKNNKFRFECKKILKEGCKINVTRKLWNGLKTLLKHDKLSLTHNGIISIISNDNTHV